MVPHFRVRTSRRDPCQRPVIARLNAERCAAHRHHSVNVNMTGIAADRCRSSQDVCTRVVPRCNRQHSTFNNYSFVPLHPPNVSEATDDCFRLSLSRTRGGSTCSSWSQHAELLQRGAVLQRGVVRCNVLYSVLQGVATHSGADANHAERRSDPKQIEPSLTLESDNLKQKRSLRTSPVGAVGRTNECCPSHVVALLVC